MTEQERFMIAAHQLGRRDAQNNLPETHPHPPYHPEELEAYLAGYRAERKRLRDDYYNPLEINMRKSI